MDEKKRVFKVSCEILDKETGTLLAKTGTEYHGLTKQKCNQVERVVVSAVTGALIKLGEDIYGK